MRIEYALALFNPRSPMSILYQVPGRGGLDRETIALNLAITCKRHPLGMNLLFAREHQDEECQRAAVGELTQRVANWQRVRRLVAKACDGEPEEKITVVAQALAAWSVLRLTSTLDKHTRCPACKGRRVVAPSQKPCTRCGGSGRRDRHSGDLHKVVGQLLAVEIDRRRWADGWRPVLADIEQLLIVGEGEALRCFAKRIIAESSSG